jgi:CRP-like cAMP-binding protein
MSTARTKDPAGDGDAHDHAADEPERVLVGGVTKPITPNLDPHMPTSDLVDRLAAHRTIGAAPREELAWLATHGALRDLDTGEILSAKNAQVSGLFVVLSGRIAIFVDRGSGPQKAMEWRDGDITGALPYSRLVNPPGDTRAQEPTTILAVGREHFRAMIRECYEITSILVHTMLDRARVFNSSDLHNEKMMSLGKLSAGLAHELNNPASAIERSASVLDDRLEDAERATRALGAARLTDSELQAVDNLRAACLAARVTGVRTPIEQAEREETNAEWLASHGLDTATAEALAETSVTLDALERIGEAVAGPALDAVLRIA